VFFAAGGKLSENAPLLVFPQIAPLGDFSQGTLTTLTMSLLWVDLA